jgi:hypothetical protein
VVEIREMPGEKEIAAAQDGKFMSTILAITECGLRRYSVLKMWGTA